MLESATSRSPTQALRRAGSTTISPTRQRPLAPARPAPQHRADPRPQLRVGERLDEVVVGPELEAAHAVLVGAAAGEDDHRQAGVEARGDPVGVADLAQHVEPGRIGQREVEQQQVGVVVAAEPQRIGSARRRQHSEAVGGQVVAEQLERRRVVLADDQAGDLSSLGKHWPV